MIYKAKRSAPMQENPPAEFHQTTWCAEKTIDFIRKNNGKNWFFNSFNCFDPHHPFDPPAEYLDKFNQGYALFHQNIR